MVSWVGDGLVSGYDPTTKKHKQGVFHLATDGVAVDTNGGTRLHWDLRLSYPSRASYPTTLRITASMTFSPADFAATPTRDLGMAAVLVKASRITGTVTPQKIFDAHIDASSKGSKFEASGQAGPQTITGAVMSFTNAQLDPNTKYWLLVYPANIYNPSGTWTKGNYDPIGSLNAHGRAISIWTNRTPAAPTITSPLNGSVFEPGDIFNITYDPNDPDALTPNDGVRSNADLAAVEVQYAPVPTTENPTPVWNALEFWDSTGASTAANVAVGEAGYSPRVSILRNLGFPILVGGGVPIPSHGHIPGGDWQIRIRVGDFGHPYPNLVNPIGETVGLNIGGFPAENVSPWSAPVRVSVPAQVPPPIPLSPRDNVAVQEGDTVRLTWQYRNTFDPPYAQASRWVQIREVGAEDWVDILVDDPSSDEFVDVPATEFTATTHYEWQVWVEDADGEVSEPSQTARFWVVPAPGSGEVIGIPDDTVDGATLGCGTHRVFVYRRGGLERVGEIRGITHLDWGRLRDDISSSKVVVENWDIDCGNLLARLQTWAYEIVIFRDNGYSIDRVWEGPISLLTYETDKVTIQAKDVCNYLYRRIIKQKMSDAGTGNGKTVTARGKQVIQNVLAPDDPNLLAYLQVITHSDDAMQYRSTPAYSRTAYEEVDDMAANAGLDYTAVGRAIILWSTKHRIGTLPEFRDENLGAAPIVSEYGMSMANVYVVSDGNGVWGGADHLDVSGNDETYGLVEMLSSTWASDSEEDSGTYTEAGLETVRESFREFSERSIEDRYPPPVVVRVPDNTTLNPNTVLSIQQLVPGVVIPLRSNGTLRSVFGNQKLDSMTVTEEAGKETITVTMSPFNRDDAAGGEGGTEE